MNREEETQLYRVLCTPMIVMFETFIWVVNIISNLKRQQPCLHVMNHPCCSSPQGRVAENPSAPKRQAAVRHRVRHRVRQAVAAAAAPVEVAAAAAAASLAAP